MGAFIYYLLFWGGVLLREKSLGIKFQKLAHLVQYLDIFVKQ